MSKKKQKRQQGAEMNRPQEEPQPEVIPEPISGTVQVGDIVHRRPLSFSDGESKNARVMRGRVVYVHPKGRFHVVEFGEGQQAVCESFMGVRR